MKKIMLVDDSRFMRSLIKTILQHHGYDSFIEAENSEQAIALYRLVQPDIIFLDITLPDMNGIECLKTIMGIDKDANVIMCSAMGQSVYISEAYDAGAKDYIVKPFQSDRIMAAIKRCSLQ